MGIQNIQPPVPILISRTARDWDVYFARPIITMEKELENYLKGTWLGSGVYRDVYRLSIDKQFVIKIAKEGGREINLIENRIWWEITGTPIQKYFAPVVSVSEAGGYLIQRVVRHPAKKDYPKELPAFFTDTKYTNFGIIEETGQFVCCDFGSFNMWRGIKLKMKKVDWWE